MKKNLLSMLVLVVSVVLVIASALPAQTLAANMEDWSEIQPEVAKWTPPEGTVKFQQYRKPEVAKWVPPQGTGLSESQNNLAAQDAGQPEVLNGSPSEETGQPELPSGWGPTLGSGNQTPFGQYYMGPGNQTPEGVATFEIVVPSPGPTPQGWTTQPGGAYEFRLDVGTGVTQPGGVYGYELDVGTGVTQPGGVYGYELDVGTGVTQPGGAYEFRLDVGTGAPSSQPSDGTLPPGMEFELAIEPPQAYSGLGAPPPGEEGILAPAEGGVFELVAPPGAVAPGPQFWGPQLWVFNFGAWVQSPAAINFGGWTRMVLYNDRPQSIQLVEVYPWGQAVWQNWGFRWPGYYSFWFYGDARGWHQVAVRGSASGWSNTISIYVW